MCVCGNVVCTRAVNLRYYVRHVFLVEDDGDTLLRFLAQVRQFLCQRVDGGRRQVLVCGPLRATIDRSF